MANLWQLVDHIGDSIERHAYRDGLTGLERAVFIARGGHAVGTRCPHEPPLELHEQHCAVNFHDDEGCDCGWARRAADATTADAGAGEEAS